MDIIESYLQHLKVARNSDNFSLLRTKDKTEIRRNFEAKSIGRDHIVKHIPDHEVKSKIMATMIMMAIRLNLVIITMIIMMSTMMAIMLSKN